MDDIFELVIDDGLQEHRTTYKTMQKAKDAWSMTMFQRDETNIFSATLYRLPDYEVHNNWERK